MGFNSGFKGLKYSIMEVFRAVLLRIQISWDVTLSGWGSFPTFRMKVVSFSSRVERAFHIFQRVLNSFLLWR